MIDLVPRIDENKFMQQNKKKKWSKSCSCAHCAGLNLICEVDLNRKNSGSNNEMVRTLIFCVLTFTFSLTQGFP